MRLAFDGTETNKRFGHIQRERNREQQQRKEKETSIQLQRKRVAVKGKVTLPSFLKIKGRGTYVGAEERRKRDSL